MDDRDGVEPQERRPPLYNPEDYVLGLKKFSKLTGLQLYLGEMEIGANNKAEQGQTNNHNGNNNNSSNNSINNNNNHNRKNKKNRSRNNAADDNETMCHTSSHPHHDSNKEMELRQFGTITELLAKLRSDLQLSFPSFVREFIGGMNDGVTLLLDALKSIQLSQTNITGSLNQGRIPSNLFAITVGAISQCGQIRRFLKLLG